jgi:hypothetical protein
VVVKDLQRRILDILRNPKKREVGPDMNTLPPKEMIPRNWPANSRGTRGVGTEGLQRARGVTRVVEKARSLYNVARSTLHLRLRIGSMLLGRMTDVPRCIGAAYNIRMSSPSGCRESIRHVEGNARCEGREVDGGGSRGGRGGTFGFDFTWEIDRGGGSLVSHCLFDKMLQGMVRIINNTESKVARFSVTLLSDLRSTGSSHTVGIDLNYSGQTDRLPTASRRFSILAL